MQLGNKLFSSNLIQGPLAGISCAPFRALTWRYSQPAYSCTEMLSCKTLLHQAPANLQRFIRKDPAEGPVCFQLSSNHPIELAEATKKVTDLGADLVDLNCGCPVKKIRSRGAGSSLLSDASKLYQLITAMKQNTHLPVSIKIRVDGNSQENCNAEVAKVVADAGADFMVVHGRHWTERYDVPCRYEEIRFFVDRLTIPIIGNGDIADVMSLKRMLQTGCHGVMIGRAGVGQPWLIRQLQCEMEGKVFEMPSLVEVGKMLMAHVSGLLDLIGNEKFAILQARQFAKYYGRRLSNKQGFMEAIHGCETSVDFEKICLHYFRNDSGV